MQNWAAHLDIHKIKISDVAPPKQDNLQKIVLPEGYQDIVQALVETHFKHSSGVFEESDVQYNVDLV